MAASGEATLPCSGSLDSQDIDVLRDGEVGAGSGLGVSVRVLSPGIFPDTSPITSSSSPPLCHRSLGTDAPASAWPCQVTWLR